MSNNKRTNNHETMSRESTMKQVPETPEKTPEKKSHAIETYSVGIPGQEQLVANTINGEQVNVRSFDRSSILDIEKKAIEESEKNTLESMKGLDITETGGMAHNKIEESATEAKDIGKIIELLDQKENMILFVDSKTIDNPSIPHEGLHMLIPKSEANMLKPHLESLGYSTNNIGDSGIEAKKGNSTLVFVYSQESNQEIKHDKHES